MRVIVNSSVTQVTPGRETVAVRIVEQPQIVKVATNDGDAHRLLGRSLSAAAPTENQVLAYTAGLWTARDLSSLSPPLLVANGAVHTLGNALANADHSLTLGSQLATATADRSTYLYLDVPTGSRKASSVGVVYRRGGAALWRTGVTTALSGTDYLFYSYATAKVVASLNHNGDFLATTVRGTRTEAGTWPGDGTTSATPSVTASTFVVGAGDNQYAAMALQVATGLYSPTVTLAVVQPDSLSAKSEFVVQVRNSDDTFSERLRVLGDGAGIRFSAPLLLGANSLRRDAALAVPTSTIDPMGVEGDELSDDNYFYRKTSTGWKRAGLSSF